MEGLSLKARVIGVATIAVLSGSCRSLNARSDVKEGAPTAAAAEAVNACRTIVDAAKREIAKGGSLDTESHFEIQKDLLRTATKEMAARAHSCLNEKSSVDRSDMMQPTYPESEAVKLGCENFQQGVVVQMDARLKSIEDCTLTPAIASELDAVELNKDRSAVCEKLTDGSGFLSSTCRMSIKGIKNAMYQAPGKLCGFMAAAATKSSDDQVAAKCGAEIITGICNAHVAPLVDAAGAFDQYNQDGTRKSLAKAYGTAVANNLMWAFSSATVKCAQAISANKVKEVVQQGIVGRANEYFKGKALKGNQALAASIGLSACKAAGDSLADAISTTRNVNYEKACSGSSFINKDWAAACVKTVATVCDGAQGNVNVAGLLGGMAEDEKVKFMADLASNGLGAACAAGGPVSKYACGAINQAAQQIRQAILTGNNDWATCLPTAQTGACLGTLWANYQSGGYTNNEGVEEAVNDSRACCWCYKDTYEDDGYFRDSQLSRENWFGVIQKGDFASGNCAYQQNRGKLWGALAQYSERGNRIYWQYRECGRVQVKGDRCAPDTNGKIYVWNPNAPGSDKYIPVAVPGTQVLKR